MSAGAFARRDSQTNGNASADTTPEIAYEAG
jgi:hypothetical protein